MTISTTTSKVSYNGNGVTTAFAFPYYFFADGDLVVTLVSSAGAETTQVLNTDYTVSGEGTESSGSVSMSVAPAVGEKLIIRRSLSLTQETDYIEGDPFPAESHERALDRLTMIGQQQQEQLSRAIVVPVGATTFSPDLPTIVAERYLRVNSGGTGFELVTAVDPGVLTVTPFIETLLDDADAAEARTTLGAAESGANDDITSLSGLTTPLSLAQGGTGTGYASNAALFAGIKQDATTSATGVVEIATDTEAQNADATKVITGANMKAAQIQLGTPVTLTNQTSVDFTGIPSWAKRVTLFLDGVSTNGTSIPQVQIGDSGGVETSGYAGSATTLSASATSALPTTGNYLLATAFSAASIASGRVVIERITGNTWCMSSKIGFSSSAATGIGEFTKTLSATLDRVRLTTVNGTDQFDAGTVNVSWE